MTSIRIMFVLFVSGVLIAFGQESAKLDRFTSMEACKAAVLSGDFQYYKPSFLNNHREVRGDEEVRGLEEKACVEMKIVGGRGYVPQAKGEKFIFKATQPVVRFDCGNDVRELEYVPEPVAEVTPPPQPEPCNCPPPAVVVEVVLPPWEPTELVAMPPEPQDPPSYEFQAELVWDKEGKRWWWRYTPLFCVDVRSPKDLWRPALCAAVAAGGFALAGGFSGGGTPLVKIPFRVPTIVP